MRLPYYKFQLDIEKLVFNRINFLWCNIWQLSQKNQEKTKYISEGKLQKYLRHICFLWLLFHTYLLYKKNSISHIRRVVVMSFVKICFIVISYFGISIMVYIWYYHFNIFNGISFSYYVHVYRAYCHDATWLF